MCIFCRRLGYIFFKIYGNCIEKYLIYLDIIKTQENIEISIYSQSKKFDIWQNESQHKRNANQMFLMFMIN